MLVLDEGEADVAVAARPEADAGADRDAGLLRQAQRDVEGAERAELLGNRRPDEHRPERRLDGPARPGEPVAERVAAAAVDLADLDGVVGRLPERDRGRDLDGLERPVVEVRLQLREGCHDLRAADDEADPPARHREGLREAVELDGTVVRAVGGEHRRGAMPVERHVGVREVVHEHEVVLVRQVDEALHVGGGRDGRGRVVREGHDHDARPGCSDGLGDRVDPAFGRRADDRCSRQPRRDTVDRVGRRRHDDRVARCRQHPQQVREPLLGADRAHDLRLRIEDDAEAARVELGDGVAKLRDPAARGVAVIGRLEGRLPQLVDGDLRRRDVGVAEAEIDDVPAFVPQVALQLVDGREDVRGQVVDPIKLHFGKYCRSGYGR